VVADLEPLTGDDVAALWRAATRRGCYPDADSCRAQAETLNDTIWHSADRARVREAPQATAAARMLSELSRHLALFDRISQDPKAWHDPIADAAPLTAPPVLISIEEYNLLANSRLTMVEVLSVLDPFSLSVTRQQAVWFGAPDGGPERFAAL
jgi:hypothetical protein